MEYSLVDDVVLCIRGMRAAEMNVLIQILDLPSSKLNSPANAVLLYRFQV